MKKVLIIGHFWPYRRGSRRIIGLAKYLPEFGWKPIVLTGFLEKKAGPGFRIIETDFRSFLGPWIEIFGLDHKRDLGPQLRAKFEKKSSRWKIFFKKIYYPIQEILAYPDQDKKWKPFAIKAAKEFLEKEKIDAIISVWPFTGHMVAKKLKEKYKIPWIADFPDLWSQNDVYSYGEVRRMIDRRLERKTLLSADALTAVSQPMVESLKEIHKQQRIIRMITHGFDPKELNEPPAKLRSKFTITYTGQVFPEQQDPAKILIALSDLISSGMINPNDIEIRFYGPYKSWLEEKIKSYNLTSFVEQYGVIDREDCLKKQRESHLLLLLKLEDLSKKGNYTGKIFEYLAALRPILTTGGSKDVITDLLKETGAGIEAPSVEDIKNSLEKLYTEYKLKGGVAYNGGIKEIDKYSEREMAKKFANILNQIIK